MIKTHKLKLDTEYFDAVACGMKNFEVRFDDRGFQRGDILQLARYGRGLPGGRLGYLKDDWTTYREEADTITREITYVLTGGKFGIECSYVVLGLAEIEGLDNGEDYA